jgi:hypothetical protein
MIDFLVSEKQSYSSRRNRSLLLITSVVGVLLVFALLSGSIQALALITLGLVALIQIYKSGNANRYFIKHIKIRNENVSIVYKDKNNEISFTGTLNTMIIRKENANRSTYLAIYSNEKLLLKQFVQGNWNETKFDEIEQYIRKLKIIGKEIG